MQRQDCRGRSGPWLRGAQFFMALVCLWGALSLPVAAGAALRPKRGRNVAAAGPVTYTATAVNHTSGAFVMNSHGVVFAENNQAFSQGGYLWKEGVRTDILFTNPTRWPRRFGGINELEQVVGQLLELPSGTQTAFLWQDTNGNHISDESELVTFGQLGFQFTSGMDVNSYGQVLISGTNPSGQGQGLFLWTPNVANGTTGQLTDLGIATTDVVDLNDYGQVAGSRFVDGVARAFLWTPDTRNGTTGQSQNLPLLGGTSNHATEISELGSVVGVSDNQEVASAFLWKPDVANGTSGQLVNLQPPQARLDVPTVATQVNSRNQVLVQQFVGVEGGADAITWLWEDGVFQNLGPAGVDLVGAALRDAPAPAHTQAVGYTGELFNNVSAVVWDQGTLLDLAAVTTKPADWKLTYALQVTPDGQILVRGTIGDSPVEQLFLLTPQFHPDRGVSITGPAETPSGTPAAFEVTVRNTGEAAATGNELQISLAAGVTVVSTDRASTVEQGVLKVALPDLAVGESAITQVELAFANPGATTLPVTVVGAGTEANPANDTASHPLTVLPSAANRAVTISGTEAGHVGSPATFNFVVSNTGQTTSTGNVLHVTLPTGAAVANSSRAGTLQGGVFTVALPSLSFQGEAATQITLIPSSSGILDVQASVTGNEPDTEIGNDEAHFQWTVLAVAAGPDFAGDWDSVTRRQQGSARRPMQQVRGTLQVRNVGTATARRSTVRLYLSSDASLDGADVEVGKLKVPALRAGKLRQFRFSKVLRNTAAADVTGKRLIAVLDAGEPGQVEEGDETNNTVVSAPLP